MDQVNWQAVVGQVNQLPTAAKRRTAKMQPSPGVYTDKASVCPILATASAYHIS